MADNHIKKYQIIISIIYSFNFIGAWFVLKLGCAPYSVIIVRCFVYIVAFLARLFYIKEKIPNFSLLKWLHNSVLETLKIIIIPIVIMTLLANIQFINMYVELIAMAGAAFVLMVTSIFIFGLNKEERKLITAFIFKRI